MCAKSNLRQWGGGRDCVCLAFELLALESCTAISAVSANWLGAIFSVNAQAVGTLLKGSPFSDASSCYAGVCSGICSRASNKNKTTVLNQLFCRSRFYRRRTQSRKGILQFRLFVFCRITRVFFLSKSLRDRTRRHKIILLIKFIIFNLTDFQNICAACLTVGPINILVCSFIITQKHTSKPLVIQIAYFLYHRIIPA